MRVLIEQHRVAGLGVRPDPDLVGI
jgi:hypothetical protein